MRILTIEGGAYGTNGVIGYFMKYNHEDEEVLVTCRGATCGTVNMSEPKSWITGNAMVVSPKTEELDKRFLYFLLANADLQATITGTAQPQITRASLSPFKIPLPPLEVQKEIVAEIEGYQKIIDGARQVVENYKSQIQIDPKWEMVELGKLTSHPIRSGAAITKQDIVENGDFKFVNIKDLYYTNGINVERLPSVKRKDIESCILRKGDVLFVRVSLKEEGVGYSSIFYSDKSNVVYGDNIFRVSPDLNRVNPWYLHYLLPTPGTNH